MNKKHIIMTHFDIEQEDFCKKYNAPFYASNTTLWDEFFEKFDKINGRIENDGIEPITHKGAIQFINFIFDNPIKVQQECLIIQKGRDKGGYYPLNLFSIVCNMNRIIYLYKTGKSYKDRFEIVEPDKNTDSDKKEYNDFGREM